MEIDVKDLHDYYWVKDELVAFCKRYGLPTGGRKLEILDRIEIFLKTGRVVQPKPAPLGAKREGGTTGQQLKAEPLTLDTTVVEFKSDSRTREFFKSVIGPEFHFTAHLNDYMRGRSDLTYGDLVKEWLAERERRKDKTYKPNIMKSCEYNQFIRDFYADETNKGKPLREAVNAWNEVKRQQGPRKYERKTPNEE